MPLSPAPAPTCTAMTSHCQFHCWSLRIFDATKMRCQTLFPKWWHESNKLRHTLYVLCDVDKVCAKCETINWYLWLPSGQLHLLNYAHTRDEVNHSLVDGLGEVLLKDAAPCGGHDVVVVVASTAHCPPPPRRTCSQLTSQSTAMWFHNHSSERAVVQVPRLYECTRVFTVVNPSLAGGASSFCKRRNTNLQNCDQNSVSSRRVYRVTPPSGWLMLVSLENVKSVVIKSKACCTNQRWWRLTITPQYTLCKIVTKWITSCRKVCLRSRTYICSSSTTKKENIWHQRSVWKFVVKSQNC